MSTGAVRVDGSSESFSLNLAAAGEILVDEEAHTPRERWAKRVAGSPTLRERETRATMPSIAFCEWRQRRQRRGESQVDDYTTLHVHAA